MPENQMWLGQNGEKRGPYPEADVRRWLRESKLAADTLAWREGMADWAALASLFPEELPTGPTPPPLSTPKPSFASSATPESFSARRNESSDAAQNDRAALPKPPSLHWGLVWLFSVLSLGIFALVWPFIQANWVRKIDDRSNATLLIGIATACQVGGYAIYFAGLASMAHGETTLVGFGGLLLLAGWVLYRVAYYSMAGSLQDKLGTRQLPVEIGGVTLFFFTTYYFQAQLSWLARWKRSGHTSPSASKAVFWVLFGVTPFVLAILAAIMIPAYQDYAVRTQVSEGLALGDNVKNAVSGYYAKHHALPPDNASAGLAEATAITGRYVSGVDVADGKIVVAFASTAANMHIRQNVLVLTPVADATDQIQWQCGGPQTTLPQKYLPAACRNR